jgi:hypothetical protein
MLVVTSKNPDSLASPSPTRYLRDEIGSRTYWEVADLMQKGRCQQARELALAIRMDDLRGLALMLVNDSRRL